MEFPKRIYIEVRELLEISRGRGRVHRWEWEDEKGSEI